jgi:hypothetical protein
MTILKAQAANTQARADLAHVLAGLDRTITAIWQSRAGDTPATPAALHQDAAQLVRENGYTPRPEGARWDVTGPHSVSSAIEAAAIRAYPDDRADAMDLAEDAHTRLAAVLHLTGQLTRRTHIYDLPDQVAAWECDPPRVEGSWPVRYRSRTQDEALAVLETAAALLGGAPGAGRGCDHPRDRAGPHVYGYRCAGRWRWLGVVAAGSPAAPRTGVPAAGAGAATVGASGAAAGPAAGTRAARRAAPALARGLR